MGRPRKCLFLISESVEECVFQTDDGVRFRVSPVDKMFVVSRSWRANTAGYLQSNLETESPFLHQLIAARMGLDLSNQIDHEDRVPSNCRRDNLRAATSTQNHANMKRPNKTGFKGVRLEERTGKYVAVIQVNRKPISLGTFNTPEEAHEAYCVAARKYFGEFANFD